ncbi:hypothetical protein LEP1GSC020_2173 [Leptospira interrogans serovar Grippotyphosa str. 2006006986]|nr:hypothetical protein LEP1GSC007_3650 [Leptospira interrogans serovar Bulgarica str. Mallika]EKO87123.1 hypothetical protein LEP1GSC009_4559 [Leptospira interrogans serovar Grippotyphosa str. Andaman]EKP85349.1 hypothetical protein LEP1GSC020_2173 [Leptospira interrogans serovar Grippotyphosa str. 2006006986]
MWELFYFVVNTYYEDPQKYIENKREILQRLHDHFGINRFF